jgi:methylenetetrahydrofolate reductase (NADPH)
MEPNAGVARVVAAAEFELIPLSGALERTAVLPPGSTVTVTASPTRGLDPTFELVEALAGRGFSAVPHLAARSIRDRGELAEICSRLRAAGVERIFVVGGDGAQAGAFPDGASLLKELDAMGHRFRQVGIPAYPEGHVALDPDALMRALLEKQPFADHVTTQLCFEAAAISAWIQRARAAGVTLPVHVGVPGPVDLIRLARVAARIGVAGAAGYLRKNRGLFGALLRRRAFRPGPIVDALRPTLVDAGANVRALHIYTFNQVEEAVAWQSRTLGRPRTGGPRSDR